MLRTTATTVLVTMGMTMTGDERISRRRKRRTPVTDVELVSHAALYRLMIWLSPAYPVGAFSYSGGIEWAVEAGDVKDAKTLREWLTVMLAEGGGFCDAVFFVHAHRAITAGDDAALHAVAELAAKLQIPVLSDLFGSRQAVFLRGRPAVLPAEVGGTLPAAAVRAFVNVNLAAQDRVVFRHRRMSSEPPQK